MRVQPEPVGHSEAAAANSGRENSRPMTAPIWAISLAGPSPIKAGSRKVEQRRGDSEGRQGTSGYVSVADVLDQLGFQYALGQFLDKQKESRPLY